MRFPTFSFSVSSKLEKLKGSIWLHCASVGEFLTAKPLAEKLKENLQKSLVITYSSPRAEDFLKNQPLADAVFPLPFPFGGFIRRFAQKLSPSLLLVAEGERYPELLKAPVKRKFLVNARLGDGSYRLLKLLSPIFLPALNSLNAILVKSEEDYRRFLSLGVDKGKLHLCGNLKAVVPEGVERIRPPVEFRKTSKVFVLGSIHPGEEKYFLQPLKRLLERWDLTIVVVPRHIENAKWFLDLFEKSLGVKGELRSRVGRKFDGKLLVVDTLGELKGFYKTADITFVGGSFIRKVGGHNLLEPAYFEKPVLYGPFIQKQKDLEPILRRLGLGFKVSSAEEFEEVSEIVLKNPPKAAMSLKELGEKILSCYLSKIDSG